MGMNHISGAIASLAQPFLTSWISPDMFNDTTPGQIVKSYKASTGQIIPTVLEFDTVTQPLMGAFILTKPPYGYSGAQPVYIKTWAMQPAAAYSFYGSTPELNNLLINQRGWFHADGSTIITPTLGWSYSYNYLSFSSVDCITLHSEISINPFQGGLGAAWSEDVLFCLTMELVYGTGPAPIPPPAGLPNSLSLVGVEIRWPV